MSGRVVSNAFGINFSYTQQNLPYLGIEPLHFYICVAALTLPIGPRWEGKRYPALRCIEIHAGGLDTLPACVLL